MTVAGNTGVNAEALKGFVSQIVMSEREKAGVATDIKEYYKSAKEAGMDTTALRRLVKWEMLSPTKREELKARDDTFDKYMQVLGFLD